MSKSHLSSELPSLLKREQDKRFLNSTLGAVIHPQAGVGTWPGEDHDLRLGGADSLSCHVTLGCEMLQCELEATTWWSYENDSFNMFVVLTIKNTYLLEF